MKNSDDTQPALVKEASSGFATGETPGSLRGAWAARQQIGYLMQQGVDHPDCLSLAAGLVDYDSLPITAARVGMERLLSDPSLARQALQYGTTSGSLELRRTLLEYLRELEGGSPGDWTIPVERCLITTGSQQFLDLVTQAVLNPGDICLVGNPTYFVYLSTLEAAGVQAVGVDCDEQGMLPAALNKQLEQFQETGELQRVKLLYLVSYFDNPRGASLSEQRKRDLLGVLEHWSDRQYIYLLEDAAYRELWFESAPAPSSLLLDDSGERVILTQTFSKSLAPGLRTGWGILPSALVKPVTDLKSVHDFGSPHLAQFLVLDLIRTGRYQQHVARLRTSYESKRNAIWEALQQEILDMPGVSATWPNGGLYVWLTLPQTEACNTRFDGPLFHACVNREQVMYVPGELFYADRDHPEASRTMRLSFGVQNETQLAEGIARLTRALKAC